MMTTYLQIDDIESLDLLFNRQSFRLRSYTFSSPFNDEMLGQRRADVVVLKEILSEYEKGAPFSFYFGVPCHSFSLKVFYVFEQTVMLVDAPIICTYLGPPLKLNSDKILS